MIRRTCALALLAGLPALTAATEPPPPGPPWARRLLDAQRTALARGTPIFVYFTKKV
jgi:hypothetical protein